MDASERDDVYGDLDALEDSANSGAEQLHYLMQSVHSTEWLSRYKGTTESGPLEPQMLPDLEPENSDASAGDVWE